MRSRFLLLALLVASPLLAQSDRLGRIGGSIGEDPYAPGRLAPLTEDRVFRVGLVRSERQRSELLRYFERLSTAYTLDAEGRMVPKPATTAIPKGGKIAQRLSATEYLMEDDYLLVVEEAKEWVDGDYVSPRPVVADGRYAFTTVLGAARTVRRYRDATGAPDLTREQFVAALQAGQSATLQAEEAKRCDACLGQGKVRQAGSKGGDESKFDRCRDCGGKGQRRLVVTHIFVWQ